MWALRDRKPSDAVPAVLDLNADFQTALAALERDAGHVFITGRAGTGKSTLLKHFLAQTDLNVAVLAPTGVAALNVGGQTIHSFFGFKPGITVQDARKKGLKPSNADLIDTVDLIVIDEASMVRADLLDCVDAFLKAARGQESEPFGGVRLAFIGDLYQLPPVVNREEQAFFQERYPTPYFFSSQAMAQVIARKELRLIELSTVYRQKDRHFLDILNTVRNKTLDRDLFAKLNSRVDPVESHWPPDAIHLVATNAEAEEVNESRLDRLPGKGQTYYAFAKGGFDKSSYPTATELTLKPGCAVMFLNNDAYGRWVNGSLGTVTAVGDESAWVKMADSGTVYEVDPHTWEMTSYRYDQTSKSLAKDTVGSFRQIPVFLAWAITVHKSQGKTFDKVVADLSRSFAPGQAYVALSRCTKLEGLTLKKPLLAGGVKLDERIVKFLTQFQFDQAHDKLGLDDRLKLLKKAAKLGHRVKITYLRDRDEKSTRVIRPEIVGEMHHQGATFAGVKGFCETFQAVRTFKVGNILEMEDLGPIEKTK